MGAGGGDYDNDGVSNPGVTDKYVGGSATWADIKDADGANGWTFVETKADFQALATGPTPAKVLGVTQTNGTIQQSRATPPETSTPY